MSNTVKAQLPFMAQSQAGRDVLVNSNYELIDHALWTTLKSISTTAPPGSPADGDGYYVPASPTGVWAGKTGQIALWKDGAWYYYWIQKPGWIAYVQDTNALILATAAGASTIPTFVTLGTFLSGAPSALQGYIGGLTLSNDGTSPNTVIDIAAGVATSDDAAVSMALSAVTKNCNAAWAVGSGNGALDSGSSLTASTWYHVFVIERTDTKVVDALISTSSASPALPTNYTKKRRIGSFKTDGSSHILTFVQNGDLFMWGSPVLDVSVNNPGVSAVTRTLTVPTGVKVRALLSLGLQATAAADMPASVLLSDLAISDFTPGVNSAASFSMYITGSGVGLTQTSAQVTVVTNISGQVRSRLQGSTTGTYCYIVTLGWFDTRGRND
jgi:hypothetical protein